MKCHLQAIVRLPRSVWQIVILASLLLMAGVLATAQQANQQTDKERKEAEKRASQQAKDIQQAASKGNSAHVQILLDGGADIETKDKQGRTALLIAAQNGRVDTVRLLLARGADATVKDKNGFTAFRLAFVNGHREVSQLLPKLPRKRLSVITTDQGGIFYGPPIIHGSSLPDRLVIEEFVKYVQESGEGLIEVVYSEAITTETGADYTGPEADAVMLMLTKPGGGSFGAYGDKLTLKTEVRLLSLPDKKVLYQKTFGGGLSGFRGEMARGPADYPDTYRRLFRPHVSSIYWSVVFALGF